MEEDKRELDVVHEQDLQTVLMKAGLWEQLQARELKCKFCKSAITLENLHSILPQAEGFTLTCDEPVCIQSLAAYLAEKNSGKTD